MNLFVILAVLAAFTVNLAFSRRWSSKHKRTSREMCQSGDGSTYMGYVSTSETGRRCRKWGRFENNGRHNYCRNPDQSVMPWCYVRRGPKFVKEFCSIPKCSTPSVKPLPAVDTERTCGERSERRMNKVVGGSFIPIDSQPWVAALSYSHRFLCGGSLIAPCWVLTAAHCLTDGTSIKVASNLSVALGRSAINETDAAREQSFTVEQMIIHQHFNALNFDNDIALLKIQSKNGDCAVKSASARTVCLPPFRTRLPAGFQCSVAGFGKESADALRFSQYLKQAEVNLISMTECKSKLFYDNITTKNMLCARSPDWSKDACGGDSGGPLVCEASGRAFLFGVVSWGDGCAKKNKPGVYTQVTKYNKWIEGKTGLSKYTEGILYPQK